VLGLELLVALGVAILLCHLAGNRYRIAPPVLLLAAGVLLGFVPALREVHLPPEVVLLLFLPALLYWESITTPLRGIRRDLRGIILMGTVLVLVTAAAVAVIAHALGMAWGPAWVLGAALAPTDATAVAAMAKGLPSRNTTLLRAESLINDGTALVIYGLAVGITVGEEHLSVDHVAWLLLLSYGGGIVIGAATAWLGTQIRKQVRDPLLNNVAIILIPFTAYLIAEAIEASGVLAVVVSGLAMSQVGPRVGTPAQRRQTENAWSLTTFLLNGALFVLIGLEANAAVRSLSGALRDAVVLSAIVTAVLIVVRFAFQTTTVWTIRLLDRRPQQRLRRMGNRSRVVGAFTGFRGPVSLAAALAVPQTLDSGEPFPDRDTIIFITAAVIVLTLLQGFLLPALLRWAHLPRDTSADEEGRLAQTLITQEALASLPQVATELGTSQDLVERLQSEYDQHLTSLRADGTPDGDPSARQRLQEIDLRLALLARKRATLISLRDGNRIDDTTLRQIQATLDIEEVRLTGIDTPE
jgi:Na+/H+ antiporter